MEPVGPHLREDVTLLDAAGDLSRAPYGQLPVLDLDGRYRGIITAHAVADALSDGEHDNASVASIVELPDAVRTTDHLADALDALESTPGAIPDLGQDRANLVGWLSHQQVLMALSRPGEDTRTRAVASGGN